MHKPEYQFRYLAYAAAHSKEPDEMMEHDHKRWPGGCMTGFILWISEQWRAWKDAQPEKRRAMAARCGGWILSDEDHTDFDRMLAEKFGHVEHTSEVLAASLIYGMELQGLREAEKRELLERSKNQ